MVKRPGAEDSESSGRALALGALLDGVPESAAIGLTLLSGGGVSGSFVVAVFLSNLPEGISASHELEDAGTQRPRIFVIWIAIAITSALAAALGYQFLGDASENFQAVTQAFAGGAILTMLATEMMPKAFNDSKPPNESRGSIVVGLVTVLGFALAAGLTSL